MKDRYYSEFISEEFYEKISALRIAKGIKPFEQFEFVFVNSNECKCKNVKENDLKTTKIDDDILAKITNIIVLGYGKWKNFSYINTSYTFIGIFDIKGNESIINIGSIALNSIKICQNYYFQATDIASCNVTISYNQFREYLDRVIAPIDKVVSSSINESLGRVLKLDIKLTMDINPFVSGNCLVDSFQFTLSRLKDFEQMLNRNMKNTKFDPEITLKIKSSEIHF